LRPPDTRVFNGSTGSEIVTGLSLGSVGLSTVIIGWSGSSMDKWSFKCSPFPDQVFEEGNAPQCVGAPVSLRTIVIGYVVKQELVRGELILYVDQY
jgi:hypothetical protein